MKILIVEDFDINSQVLEIMLKNRGHESDIAVNGLEALKLYESGVYDLIFMDVRMPIMDGYEAADRIRQMENERKMEKTPIIALSADIFVDRKDKQVFENFDKIILKPIRIDLIDEVLDFYKK